MNPKYNQVFNTPEMAKDVLSGPKKFVFSLLFVKFLLFLLDLLIFSLSWPTDWRLPHRLIHHNNKCLVITHI